MPVHSSQPSKIASGLAAELERRVERLIEDYKQGTAQGKTSWPDLKAISDPFTKWFLDNFRVGVSTTPKGGKALKELALKFLWAVKNIGPFYGGTALVEDDWAKLRPQVPALVAGFSAEGSAQVLAEVKTSHATYLNLRGVSAPTFQKYVKSLDAIFGAVKGWRAKALSGGFKVALAGPEHFRGTAKGVYRVSEDTLFVRATPEVMKRSAGYASPEYILIHELGHRYEHKVGTPDDFRGPRWYTTKYSLAESGMGTPETFAEMFALGHFGITSYGSTQFGDKLADFEQVMQGKRMVMGKETEDEERIGQLLAEDLRQVTGTVVSPDYYLHTETGEYVWSQERVIEAWRKATARLDRLISTGHYTKLVLLIGLPASGKSTWLKSHQEKDAIYLDATMTIARYRAPYIQKAKDAGLQVEAVVMDTPIAVCIDRNSCRTPDRQIPLEAIQRMHAELAGSPPKKSEGFDSITHARTVAGASYPGNLGAIEMVQFYRVGKPHEIELMEKYLDKDNLAEAWELLMKVTKTRLHDMRSKRASDPLLPKAKTRVPPLKTREDAAAAMQAAREMSVIEMDTGSHRNLYRLTLDAQTHGTFEFREHVFFAGKWHLIPELPRNVDVNRDKDVLGMYQVAVWTAPKDEEGSRIRLERAEEELYGARSAMKKTSSLPRNILKALEPVCLDPDDADSVWDDILDALKDGIQKVSKTVLTKLRPYKAEGDNEESNGREGYWYTITHPEVVHTRFTFNMEPDKRWAMAFQHPRVARGIRKGTTPPVLDGQARKEFIEALSDVVLDSIRLREGDKPPEDLDDAVLDWAERNFHLSIQATSSHTDVYGEEHDDAEASDPEVRWWNKMGELSITLKEQGHLLKITYDLPIKLSVHRVGIPGDYDYGRYARVNMNNTRKATPVWLQAHGLNRDMMAEAEMLRWWYKEKTAFVTAVKVPGKTPGTFLWDVRLVPEGDRFQTAPKEGRLKTDDQLFKVYHNTAPKSRGLVIRTVQYVKMAPVKAPEPVPVPVVPKPAPVPPKPAPPKPPAPPEPEALDIDDVTRFLRKMNTKNGGRVEHVDFYPPGHWSVDLMEGQRLDHYRGRDYDYDNDDEQGWDQDGWDREYANPLQDEIERKLADRFGPNLFYVEISDKRGFDVQLIKKGKRGNKTAEQVGNQVAFQRVLALLRAMSWNYTTSHWQVAGASSYGDHLLFARLYEKMSAEVDGLAEKMVGLFGVDVVDAASQAELMSRTLSDLSSVGNPFERGLLSERNLQAVLVQALDTVEGKGLGMDDMLRTLANDHETHIYLLQQRLRAFKMAGAGIPGDRALAARFTLAKLARRMA